MLTLLSLATPPPAVWGQGPARRGGGPRSHGTLDPSGPPEPPAEPLLGPGAPELIRPATDQMLG